MISCAYAELKDPLHLVPHPKNPNKHDQAQIDTLARLISFYGFRHPIIVSKQTGFIVAGHGRLEAAKKLGLKEVPVDYQDFTDDAQEYGFLVADNAIAGWSELDLAKINVDFVDLGPDFDVDMLGIKDFVIEPIDKLEPGCDEDDVPEHVEPKSKLGDIYKLGNHRLMCGDSTSIDAVDKLMNGDKAQITFTSPPYNAGRNPMKSERERPGKQDKKYNQYQDDGDQSDWKQLVSDALTSAMTASSYQLINVQHLAGNKVALLEWLHDFRIRYVDTVIWDKQHGIPSMASNVLNSRFEYVFVFADHDKPTRGISDASFSRDLDNVYAAPRQTKNEFAGIHAATFPVHLPEHFVSQFTKTGTGVFDPFGGTGTTLIACEKTNRKCFMMELDPHYCDVIVARWEKFTGQKAELNGQT